MAPYDILKSLLFPNCEIFFLTLAPFASKLSYFYLSGSGSTKLLNRYGSNLDPDPNTNPQDCSKVSFSSSSPCHRRSVSAGISVLNFEDIRITCAVAKKTCTVNDILCCILQYLGYDWLIFLGSRNTWAVCDKNIYCIRVFVLHTNK